MTPQTMCRVFALVLFVSTVADSHACTPPRDGVLQVTSFEDDVRAALKYGDSSFVASIVSERDIDTDADFNNRQAQLRPGEVVYGKAVARVRFHESTCGSPLQELRPIRSGELLLLVTRKGALMRAYRNASPEAKRVREMIEVQSRDQSSGLKAN